MPIRAVFRMLVDRGLDGPMIVQLRKQPQYETHA
jgi:hypothetical protein